MSPSNPIDNNVSAAVATGPGRIEITVDGPPLDPVPAGIQTDFAMESRGVFRAATVVVLLAPNLIEIFRPNLFTALDRVRYVPAGIVWFNASAGRLTQFNVPLPFP